eukprot:764442-Hanusia_phi.AAC.10
MTSSPVLLCSPLLSLFPIAHSAIPSLPYLGMAACQAAARRGCGESPAPRGQGGAGGCEDGGGQEPLGQNAAGRVLAPFLQADLLAADAEAAACAGGGGVQAGEEERPCIQASAEEGERRAGARQGEGRSIRAERGIIDERSRRRMEKCR